MRQAKRPFRSRHQHERGLTLIELLVVIAVLAILASIVIFNITGVFSRGARQACLTDLQTVQTASDVFRDQKGSYPATLDDLVPQYVHTKPTSLGSVSFNSDGHGTVTSSNC